MKSHFIAQPFETSIPALGESGSLDPGTKAVLTGDNGMLRAASGKANTCFMHPVS